MTVAEHRFACGAAARWLPRALAASILVTVALAAARVDPTGVIPTTGSLRIGLFIAAGLLALWVLRKGAELRLGVEVGSDRLLFFLGKRNAELLFDDVEALGYDPPFAPRKTWIPALALIDRDGKAWRIAAMVDRGGRLVDDLLERSGREDLAAWADALQLRRRMAVSRRRVAVGYVIAAALVGVGLGYLLH